MSSLSKAETEIMIFDEYQPSTPAFHHGDSGSNTDQYT
jgi:hypothetical protein